MKKILSISTAILLLFISMSFVLIHTKKINKSHASTERKTSVIQTCTCSTPGGIRVSRSGGTVTIIWNPSAGAKRYSVVGSSCPGSPGFGFCTTATSVSFPSSCYVTFRVGAYCNGTNCTDATCASTLSNPIQSN